jgi:hypothetical protein
MSGMTANQRKHLGGAISGLLALVSCFGLAANAQADGWRRPGTTAESTPRDTPRRETPPRAMPAAEQSPASEEGPALFAPEAVKASYTPARRAPRKRLPAPELPTVEEVQDAPDDWAEQAMHQRRGADQEAGGVAPASHRSMVINNARQAPPSAYSGDRPTGPTPAQEELPLIEDSLETEPRSGARRAAPPINGDQFLMSDADPEFMIGDEQFGGDCADCGSCDTCGPSCGGGGCGHHGWLQNLSVFGGFHAFKGPVDRGQNGNFGLHEGINWGSALWYARRLGYQVGGQILHSDLSGNNNFFRTSASRTQYFITVGMFQRAIAGDPWQWGVAFDGLNDEYFVNQRMSKVRAEISFVGSQGEELGFWTSVGTDSATANYENNGQLITTTWESVDLFAFFYRKTFSNFGQGRVWGGFTDTSDGLFGGDYRVPLGNYLAISGNANYLIPSQGGANGGVNQESWNLSMNLVWHIGGGATASSCSPWRPLFDVADNSIFMMRTK